jgi:hypothetical protein
MLSDFMLSLAVVVLNCLPRVFLGSILFVYALLFFPTKE